jgi:hypothetical protein
MRERHLWPLTCVYIPGMKLLKPLLSWSIGSQRKSCTTSKTAPSGEKADSRFHGRFKIKSRVTLSWQDAEGRTCTIPARAVDMSRLGARVESPEPMAPGSFAFIQAPELNLMGGAIVRHCVLRGMKYRIGLEFRNPLTKCF